MVALAFIQRAIHTAATWLGFVGTTGVGVGVADESVDVVEVIPVTLVEGWSEVVVAGGGKEVCASPVDVGWEPSVLVD